MQLKVQKVGNISNLVELLLDPAIIVLGLLSGRHGGVISGVCWSIYAVGIKIS